MNVNYHEHVENAFTLLNGKKSHSKGAKMDSSSSSDGSDQNEENSPKLIGLLSADEVSAFLKISKRTLWRLLSSGAVPKPLRFGGNVRWSQEALEEWVEKGCPRQI